jgi:hypothetical protein
MLYKWLFTSFLLNVKHRRDPASFVVLKNTIDDVIEKSMNEYIKEPIPPVDNTAVIGKFFKRETSGRDERYDHYYNETKNDHEVVLNISKFMVQMELLRKLECTTLSQNDKLKHIEEYEKVHGRYKYANNITAGGLFNDFLKEI